MRSFIPRAVLASIGVLLVLSAASRRARAGLARHRTHRGRRRGRERPADPRRDAQGRAAPSAAAARRSSPTRRATSCSAASSPATGTSTSRRRATRPTKITDPPARRVGAAAAGQGEAQEGRRRRRAPELQAAAAKADAAYKEGRFADARAEYEKLLALRPDLAPDDPPADRLRLRPGEAVREGGRGAREGARRRSRERPDPRDRRAGRARGQDGRQGARACSPGSTSRRSRAPTSSSTWASTSSTPARCRTRSSTSARRSPRTRPRRRLLPARARLPRPGQVGRGQGRLPEGGRARARRRDGDDGEEGPGAAALGRRLRRERRIAPGGRHGLSASVRSLAEPRRHSPRRRRGRARRGRLAGGRRAPHLVRRGLALPQGRRARAPSGPTSTTPRWRALDLPHDWAIEGPFDPKISPHQGALPVLRRRPGTASTSTLPAVGPGPLLLASSSTAPCRTPRSG